MNIPADDRFVSRSDPKLLAGALALGVHLAFVLLLVFGVSWQTQHPAPVMVDIWQALPEPRPAAAKPAKLEPEPARPVPVPRAEEPPPPKAPDIALEKKKAEAERLKKLQAIEAAEEKAREKAAREKLQAEQKKRELLRQMEQDMEQHIANEEAAREAQAMKQAAARAAASARQTEVSRIARQNGDLISAKVRGNTRLPDNLKGNLEVRYLVKLLPSGEVVSARKTKSSGNVAFDEAVERAIHRSSPLPLPADREARAEFVPEFTLIHSP